MGNKWKDWQIRAVKTFVQAFGGVLVPELVMILSTGVPESWSKVWTLLAPVICAALAAGISAAWNIISEKLREEEIYDRTED